MNVAGQLSSVRSAAQPMTAWRRPERNGYLSQPKNGGMPSNTVPAPTRTKPHHSRRAEPATISFASPSIYAKVSLLRGLAKRLEVTSHSFDRVVVVIVASVETVDSFDEQLELQRYRQVLGDGSMNWTRDVLFNGQTESETFPYGCTRCSIEQSPDTVE